AGLPEAALEGLSTRGPGDGREPDLLEEPAGNGVARRAVELPADADRGKLRVASLIDARRRGARVILRRLDARMRGERVGDGLLEGEGLRLSLLGARTRGAREDERDERVPSSARSVHAPPRLRR